MKKFLSIFLLIFFCLVSFFSAQSVNAQNPPIGGIPALPTQPLQTAEPSVPVPTGRWVVDPEVTFAGKNAARSGLLLDWTLQNYNWACVNKIVARTCDNETNNPIAQYWFTIVTYLVVPILFFVILASAAVIIITRGRSLTIMRFIPRFIAVGLLIVFSYSIVQFLYQFADMIQGFFLRSGDLPCPPDCISNKDLLYVGWDYRSFVGIRLLGDYYAESAFISTLYTKLTAFTYFVMVFMLLMRKIILWFFIVVSPIFPILLLYYPLRNTGKIWIGEFFRWLMYAPLFAIFLKGLVYMWRNQIPLWFVPPGGPGDIGNTAKIIFPTPINIILGGPQQFVTPVNSINLTETFALYTVALLMLWVVMLLPWVLLKIFLEYGGDFSGSGAAFMKSFVTLATKQKIPSMPGPGSTGMAMNVPFTKKFTIPTSVEHLQPTGTQKEIVTERTIPQSTQTTRGTNTSQKAVEQTAQPQTQRVKVDTKMLSVTSVPLPSIRDIAKFETSLISKDKSVQQPVQQVIANLEKIANPASITNAADRQKYSDIKSKLLKEKEQGNPLATSILKAAESASKSKQQQASASLKKASTNQVKQSLQEIANPNMAASVKNKERLTKLREKLSEASKESQLASSILSVSQDTSVANVEKIRERLLKAGTKSDKVASKVSSVASSKDLHMTLQQIAHPETITDVSQRAQFAQLHNELSKESKEKNNQLATSILSVNENTTTQQLEKIQTSLKQSKEGDIASSVAATINETLRQKDSSQQIKNVVQQAKSPTASPALRETLLKASKEGNQLASQILTFDDQASEMDIEDLQEKIMEAKLKGDPVATQITEMTQTSVPQTNRIQEVRNEDYLAVKDMWKENYHNLEVPDGMAGSRTDWIKDDIENIDDIVSKLSSTDQEKVSQGLQEVSNILPFLMVGGFSQTEIIAYLKAKQDAAKEVTAELVEEEETQVSVGVAKKATERTMAATMDEDADSDSVRKEGSKGATSNAAEENTAEKTNPTEEPEESPLKDVLDEQDTVEPKPEEPKKENN